MPAATVIECRVQSTRRMPSPRIKRSATSPTISAPAAFRKKYNAPSPKGGLGKVSGSLENTTYTVVLSNAHLCDRRAALIDPMVPCTIKSGRCGVDRCEAAEQTRK